MQKVTATKWNDWHTADHSFISWKIFSVTQDRTDPWRCFTSCLGRVPSFALRKPYRSFIDLSQKTNNCCLRIIKCDHSIWKPTVYTSKSKDIRYFGGHGSKTIMLKKMSSLHDAKVDTFFFLSHFLVKNRRMWRGRWCHDHHKPASVQSRTRSSSPAKTSDAA